MCVVSSSWFAMVYAATKQTYWPNNSVSFGYYDHRFVSPHIPTPPSPLFWHASFKTDNAAYLWYERLLVHSEKYFALYGGGNVARLGYNREVEMAFSMFLDMHFYIFHQAGFNLYINYSIAAPTLLSNRKYGHTHYYNNFVFQDMLGVGLSFGPKLPIAVGFDVVHYSNGDIFPVNGGIQIPFVLWLAYQF